MKHDLGKILFCNIAEMTEYKGDLKNDPLYSEAEFVKKKKYGFELYNFLKREDGYIYGFVQPVGEGINLEKIDPHTLDTDDFIDGVLVIFIAPKENVTGSYIVGWYKNATVFRYTRDYNVGKKDHSYNIKVEGENSVLIPLPERIRETHIIPPRGGGTAYSYENIGEAKREEVLNNMRRAVQYVNNYK